MKLGGIVLSLSALLATGGATAPAIHAPVDEAAKNAGGIYATMDATGLDSMAVELCEHLTGGYSIDDAVSIQADLFGVEAGKQFRLVAEAIEQQGC